MNLTDPKYQSYALVKEMLETPAILRNFDWSQTANMTKAVQEAGRFFMTGEGSSRIFPAKNMIYTAMKMGSKISMATDGSIQAREYDLNDWAVCGVSNSGMTKEIILLLNNLADQNHQRRFAVTANAGTKIVDASNDAYILSCGKEDAVAATKSVVESGLMYLSVLKNIYDVDFQADAAATAAEEALALEIDPEIVAKVANSPVIYFAGRNNGVAEELRLKTNEITRKKSDYLEGTYLLHGIEEVMNAGETIVVIEPYESEMAKMQELLVDRIGVNIIAIASKPTIFPTVVIPSVGLLDPCVQLMAGWNLLVQVGISLGIDLDHPTRARKVGNAF